MCLLPAIHNIPVSTDGWEEKGRDLGRKFGLKTFMLKIIDAIQ